MKTAISIPDELLSDIERTAKKLGIPRSQLFARALEEFITNHAPQDVTARINQILETENSSVDAHLAAMQAATMSSAYATSSVPAGLRHFLR